MVRSVLGRGLFLIGHEALFNGAGVADLYIVLLRQGHVVIGDLVTVGENGDQTCLFANILVKLFLMI